jgi:hypothetical protein
MGGLLCGKYCSKGLLQKTCDTPFLVDFNLDRSLFSVSSERGSDNGCGEAKPGKVILGGPILTYGAGGDKKGLKSLG